MVKNLSGIWEDGVISNLLLDFQIKQSRERGWCLRFHFATIFWRCLLQHCQSWNERLPRVEVSIYAFAEHVHVFDINSGFYFCLQVHLLVWVVSEEQAGFCSNLFFMICWWQSEDIWSCCFMEFIQNFFPVL